MFGFDINTCFAGMDQVEAMRFEQPAIPAIVCARKTFVHYSKRVP